MDSLARTLDVAVRANDYAKLATVFSDRGSSSATSWSSVGQGEQRALAAQFIRLAVASPTFLPAAFSSPEMMGVMSVVLGHLPITVEGAADNLLRQKLFDYKVHHEEDFSGAARVLGGMRMDDDPHSVYYTNPAEKCDVYVKIAECFLEEDETVEADSAVTKAGTVVESISNPESHVALILRYKSTYARVLDANRKFLQAAQRYHDLSQTASDMIDADDVLNMLGRAATCAILAPSGPQRQRVLGHICKDNRLRQLDAIPAFQTHSTIITKMYKNQIIGKEELTTFEASLAPHQKAVMGDGLTLMERGVVEHNMIAVGRLYQSVYISELGRILGVDARKAEKIAANMIMDGSLNGSIDQVDGLLEFHQIGTPQSNWDKSITDFCIELNRVVDAIKQA